MRRVDHGRGLSLTELLAAVALLAIGLLLLLPPLAEMRESSLSRAGAKEIATTLQALRWKSVSRNRSHGLFFQREDAEWVWYEVQDGNGNGLRTSEVRDGTDPVRSGPHRFAGRLEPVRLGFPEGGEIPRIPPNRGSLRDLDDPVKFGRSDLVSFSPLGSASSGTVYLTGSSQSLYGIVLFGPTARVRVWRYDRRTGRWTL